MMICLITPLLTHTPLSSPGPSDSLTMCINQLSAIIFENPAKGPHVPYKPHTLPNQAYQPRVNVSYAQTSYHAQISYHAQSSSQENVENWVGDPYADYMRVCVASSNLPSP